MAADADPGQPEELTTEPVVDPATQDVPADTDRVLTVPNVVSVVRLLCIPVFLWLLFGRDDEVAAAYLLAALGATDWVDGYVARHFHQVSTLGKILDPTADRLLLAVAVVGIFAVSDGPVRVVCVLTVVREAVVAVAALSLAALGARRIDVTWFGKAGTFALLIAFPLFLGSAPDSDLGWKDTAEVLAWGFAVPGLVLSYWSAVLYVPLAKRALAEGRVGSAP